MGIRETLNKQPIFTTGATIGIIVLALGFIIYQVMAGGRPSIPTKAYYTIDDGATYFSDDINLVAPFDYEGHPAVKADVFSCGGKKLVGYLERYTDAAKKLIEDGRTKSDPSGIGEAMSTGLEVKAPNTGDSGWINTQKMAAGKITNFTCPNGSGELPEPVVP